MIAMVQNLQNTASLSGGRPRDLALFRKVLGPTETPDQNVWWLLRRLKEGVDYTDAHAGGSVDVDEVTGDISIVVTFGNRADPASPITFQVYEDYIARGAFAPALEFPPVTGLSLEDRAALEWVKNLRHAACS